MHKKATIDYDVTRNATMFIGLAPPTRAWCDTK